VHETGPADSTAEIVAGLNEYAADLFITSGHATEHDWQLGYRYKNGQFRCKDGQIFGRDTGGKILPVQSEHPRVYLPVGNCLMGHIAGRDCMALAFMNSAGVMQMAGYTVETWYGYAGWGMLDYFVEQPGRFMLAEAFVANQNALIHRMREKDATAGEIKGLAYDSETFAFYGDPAWEARMADGPLNWEQLLSRSENDTYTFVVTPRYAERTFEAVNTNGSQRGGRPVIQFLPHRLGPAKIFEGAELNPVITDDFILIPLPKKYDPKIVSYKLVFQALEI
jgi:zinc protease